MGTLTPVEEMGRRCGGWGRANSLQTIPASTSDPTADLAPDLVNSPSGEHTTSKDPSSNSETPSAGTESSTNPVTNGIVLPVKDSMDGEESGGSAGAAIVLPDIPTTLQMSSLTGGTSGAIPQDMEESDCPRLSSHTGWRASGSPHPR